jgi:predicted O-methyltransferase YrrM
MSMPVPGEEFHAAVRPLFVPEMGTECTAYLLYWLVRMTRPRKVLEIGMGYTTPFLAKALHDNVEAVTVERELLGTPASVVHQPLAHPGYYDEPYEPRLICIDRMTEPESSAPRAHAVLTELGLADRVSVIETDLRGSSGEVREKFGLLDFAWIDTWDTLAFLREYWGLVDPAGGVLAVHYLMTYPEGRAIQHYLNSLRGPEGGHLEVTNFREPHKTYQNSITLIRRIRDYVEPMDMRPFGTRKDPKSVLLGDNP